MPFDPTKPIVNSPAAMYGIRTGFSIADLPTKGLSLLVIDNVTVASSSAMITNGAKSIEVNVQFTAPNTTCIVHVLDNQGNVLLTSPVLSITNTTFFAGGWELVNLAGVPYQITVDTITNPAALSVFVKKTS